MTTRALFWIVGMIAGGAIAAMIGKSFMDDRGRKSLPIFIVLGLVFGLVVGWALNAWNDYIHFTQNGGNPGL